jgi:hypothetical protein
VPGEPLGTAELRLLECCIAGTWLDCGSSGLPETGAADEWGPERTIRAAVLRYLLTGPEWPVSARGVRARGARVSGVLDLGFGVLRCPLVLEGCYLDGAAPLVLDDATGSEICLSDCRQAGTAGGIRARRVTTSGNFDLCGSVLAGKVDLSGASIGGYLLCHGTQLPASDDGESLTCKRSTIGRDLWLTGGFTAGSAVCLADGDITGDLDCSGAQFGGAGAGGCALDATRVRVGGHLRLDQALLAGGSVSLTWAQIGGHLTCGAARMAADRDGQSLTAIDVKVNGDVNLQQLTADGCVYLSGAQIGGSVIGTGARLAGDANGTALACDMIRCDRGALLLEGLVTSGGSVSLVSADIAADVSLSGARLSADRDGNSLIGVRLKARGGVTLDECFTAGAVKLISARITAGLICTGTQVSGADADGIALDAGHMTAAEVILDGLHATGAVSLAGAHIAGNLLCEGTRITRSTDDGVALMCAGITVGGDVLLTTGFASSGSVVLTQARVNGDVCICQAVLCGQDALLAAGLHAAGALCWLPADPVTGTVDLDHAQVGEVSDDWDGSRVAGHWPSNGNLRLQGFSYSGFSDMHLPGAQQRLNWIRLSSPPLAPQPYRQLTSVYRQAGMEQEARRVAIAQRNDLRLAPGMSLPHRAGNWLLDKTIKHGYQPLRAVGLLAIVYLAMLLTFWAAQHHGGLIVPADGTRAAATACTSGYPCFYPAGYAFDTVVPVISLGQASHWRINAAAPWGWAYTAASCTATILGWALATLAVAGFTGLVRKELPPATSPALLR